MIDSVLERGPPTSYPYAARNLSACEDLADRIDGSACKLGPHRCREPSLWLRYADQHP